MTVRRASRLAMLAGCTVASVAGSAAVADADTLTAPARVWAGACAYCHAQGVAPPIFGLGLAPAAIAVVVRSGLNGMPAFHPSELTAAQLNALAEWIARQPAAPAGTASVRTAPASTAPASTAPTNP